MTPVAEPSGPADPTVERIRVLVADDHVLYRRGLEMVLGQEGDIEICGEANDGAEAIVQVEELLPDVVLMDVRMPRLSGPDATAQIKASVPSTRIIMLTISDEEQDLYDAVRAGANGYLLKDVPGEQIADGIRQVHAGQSLISPSMASKLLAEFASLMKRADERPAMPVPKLTDRELEVLKLVARGMANRDIAKELFISENTVKNHVRNILEKLQLHSRMEAVMFAVREKILDLPT
ncbi:response regulator transcription factor [Arsenicicoccus piscis]|uniref:DNA-binding response regulator n=1 Tax=Arsenicicoccus piscis TaxID=673954 RepID=A0ABQ6HJ54_9MICO|nr:response regulator transcription factor [Arsenicicoccus piscis]MCH8628290.1 response regulator transcription factor [Arsenicicoccus piscis]GMA18549.1 DNA-binding response regulator [Arsenicicoccus piscis]